MNSMLGRLALSRTSLFDTISLSNIVIVFEQEDVLHDEKGVEFWGRMYEQ